MTSSNDQISQSIKVANNLFTKAQECVVYRASVAYILQQIKNFIQAIQGLRNRQLNPPEIIALERFTGLMAHFSTVLPNLGANWVRSVLNWPATHVHEYIDSLRKSLIEICQLLSLKSDQIINYDPIQDQVNKIADFQHLKEALLQVQQKSISIDNAVDVQQLIETRLYSITRHLPKKKEEATAAASHHPSSEATPMDQLRSRLDNALTQFRSIDIPEDDVIIGKALGSGGFGTVFIGTRISTGELIAVKEVRSDKLSISTWASLYAEVANMANLHHRYVLELVGAHIKEPYRIITRYCPGKSLFDRIHRSPQHPLSPAKLTSLAYQVACGMQFLHSNGIVHRDLKTMNILLDESDAARIADFGLSGNMRDNKDLYGTLGTPHYTAPEVLSRKRYGPKVDSYSYGIVLWEMETGLIPFRDKTHKEIIEHVVQRGWRLPLSKTVPEGLRRLITRCWSENPSERPEFEEIVNLFKKGEVYFGTPNDKVQLEAGTDYPPINQQHATQVLSDPNSKAFPSLVDFFVANASPELVDKVRSAHIVNSYTKDSAHPDKILIAAGKLLNPDEFPRFIATVGGPIIEDMLKNDSPHISAAIQFCISVPKQHLSLISHYTKSFVDHVHESNTGLYVLRFLACLGKEEVIKYQDALIDLFSKKTLLLEDQETLNAIAIVIPYIADKIQNPSILLPLLASNLVVPEEFAMFLVHKMPKDQIVDLISALLLASLQSPLEKPLYEAIERCTDDDIADIADNSNNLEAIRSLLLNGQCVSSALLLLFRMAKLQPIAAHLANHPALAALFECKDHTQQRIQVLTALVLCPQFVLDTAMMNDVLKILVASLSIEELQRDALKLIGALSGTEAGCKILDEAGLLAVFSQLFLSPVCNDAPVALTILRNCSRIGANIPQKSLIISCLMQDLTSSMSAKSKILYTLIQLLQQSPDFVQEHDLQNSILPILTPKSGPVVVTLCLQLLDSCDIKKLRMIYRQILNRIYIILSTPEMIVPELLLAVTNILVSMWTAYQQDVIQFVSETHLIDFFNGILPSLEQYQDIYSQISQRVFILGVSPVNDEPPKPLKRSSRSEMKQSEFVLEEEDFQDTPMDYSQEQSDEVPQDYNGDNAEN